MSEEDLFITNLQSTFPAHEIFAIGQWLVNSSITVSNEVLMAYVKCNPSLALLDFGRVLIQRDHLSLDKVKILSGGATGHEPAFAGYVGKGFLTAAVQGRKVLIISIIISHTKWCWFSEYCFIYVFLLK